MKINNSAHALCRDETTAYLKCRMQKGLMTEEAIEKFGLQDPIDYQASERAQAVSISSNVMFFFLCS
jgi:hypothetical protein